uniref:Mfs general substrate transporter n=1 Tax=Tetraselmis sp. GSL018 TaxID=582737 RepID=A0A061QPB7_9CHLO
MYINKWIVVCAASFTQLSAGLPYCFSVYSEALKQHFNWTQIQLQTVGFACSLGAYLGVISGLFYDWLRKYDKLGPRLTLLIGMTMNIVGFTALWAAGSGYINASLWQVAIFAWIAHNNGTWFDTSSMVTTVRNFPNHRGTVVGAMKSITGISGAIYVQVYLGFFAPDSIGFILFLALMPFAISCVTICFLNHVPFVTTAEVGRSTNKRLLFMYGVIIVLAVYVTLTALWQGLTKVPHHVSVWITYGVGLLLAPLLLLPVRSGGFRAQPLDPNDPLAPRTGDRAARRSTMGRPRSRC